MFDIKTVYCGSYVTTFEAQSEIFLLHLVTHKKKNHHEAISKMQLICKMFRNHEGQNCPAKTL